jgi:hypothetical protein
MIAAARTRGNDPAAGHPGTIGDPAGLWSVPRTQNSFPSGSASTIAPSVPIPSRVAPSEISRSTAACWSPAAVVSSKRCRFGSFLGLDRGLLVLVPHQRPAQHLAPEQADFPGAVTGELTEQTAPGEVGVAGLDHAEPIAGGIGQDDVPFLRSLSHVEMAATKLQRRRHGVLLIVEIGAGQVQVHAAGSELAGAARNEPETELGVLARQKHTHGILDDLPAEQSGPEPRRTSRVVRLEGHRQQSRTHHQTVDTAPARQQGTNELVHDTRS